jgi:hypothetical protein
VTKLFGFLGATPGGWLAWALGARVGFMTAFIGSIVGRGRASGGDQFPG